MKQLLLRWLFLGLSSAIIVFFSEKAYWYPQGYPLGELIFFYAFPLVACLWAIEYFQVRRLSALVLIGALLGFLVEGVLTPVIFEGGLLDPIMPGYFIGWHGLLSFVLGWYLLRKWLIKGQWGRLLIGSTLFGLFWGGWSPIYWLPENFEGFANPGQWPVVDFALYAFTFTLLLIGSHWLLGVGGWQAAFKLGRIEKSIIVVILIFLYATLSFPAAPFGLFKLIILCVTVFVPLGINRQREDKGSILNELTGPINPFHLLGLLVIPLTATAVYGLTVAAQPSPDFLRAINELVPLGQAMIGLVLFLWAIIDTIRPLQITNQSFIGESA